jgi:hypothetical protein
MGDNGGVRHEPWPPFCLGSCLMLQRKEPLAFSFYALLIRDICVCAEPAGDLPIGPSMKGPG